jgi:glycosyltransferase involved in cell wall biosynthesis
VTGERLRLLVIIPDKLSDLITKGEITSRYYNPGELFDEVHILMTNDDNPDPEPLQKTVGKARLYLYNLPAGRKLFTRSLGWQPFLLRRWVDKGLKIAEGISLHLVRVHNNFKEGYLAFKIKEKLGIPYVISLHGVWDRDEITTIKGKMVSFFKRKLEKLSLKNSDHVIAVYKPILRYAEKYGAPNISLIYNVVASKYLKEKKDYKIRGIPRIITVNRQVREKNPENIIRAISNIDCQYTIVGDGPYHEYLKTLARGVRVENKVEFIRAISNDRLCSMLSEYDLMVSHCDYWGVSKTLIEASIVGLPIVINEHPIEPIPEYEGNWLVLCKNTPEGYAQAIKGVLSDFEYRKKLGLSAKVYAKNNWWPEEMENNVAYIYREVMEKYQKP